MNRTIALIALMIILLSGVYLITRSNDGMDALTQDIKEEELLEQSTDTYSNPSLELSFEYPNNETGYVLQESTPSDAASGIVRSIVLMEQEDAAQAMPVNGEGPATITINVFENTNKQFPLAWAQTHTQYSNSNLMMGTETQTVVGGANAIRYMADGLYPNDTVVVAHGSHIYVITAMYADGETGIKNDFGALLDSITFIPEAGTQTSSGAQGKLNIQAVCEGALAYMTFADGESADAFVQECINGEHPEVIERYKAEINLGADVAI